MIILDTSVWIEYFKKNPQYFDHIKILLEEQEILAVELIFGELLQGVKNKREKTIILGYWENLPQADSKGLWIKAGIYSSDNKLLSKGVGLIDNVIVEVARKYKARIWTLDKKLMKILHDSEIYNAGDSL